MKNFFKIGTMILCMILCAISLIACNEGNDQLKEPDAPSMDIPTDTKEPEQTELIPGPDGYAVIEMNEFQSYMDKYEEYIILDVRTYDEFAEGHIPNAINISNENIEIDALDMLTDKDALIFVYCRSGNRSKQAAKKLVELGYTNIIECGGVTDWSGELVTEEPLELLLPLRLPMPDVLTYRFEFPRLFRGNRK